jgi:RNA polymerase-binding transcription factor DksA
VTPDEIEKHSDPHDVASDLEMMATEAAIYEARKKSKRDQEPDAKGAYEIEDCIECGNEIGAGRLKFSIRNTLCVECATVHERRNGR